MITDPPLPKPPTVHVYVSKEIIARAKPENFSRCMVAEALRQQGWETIDVTSQRAKFALGPYRYFYEMPIRVMEAISKFDKGIPVKPFSFTFQDGTVKLRRKMGSRKAPYRFANKSKTAGGPKKCIRRVRGLKTVWIGDRQVG